LSRSGRDAEAVTHLSAAVRLQPDQPDVRVNLGLALARTGEIVEAVEQYREALRINPGHARAYNGLAWCLIEQGHTSEAINLYREAMRLEPRWPLPASRLAWVYATDPDPAMRDGAEAIRLAEHVLASVANPTPEMLDTLAAAYAESGRHEDAVRTALRALEACASSGTKSLAREIRARLELYRAGRQYRRPNG